MSNVAELGKHPATIRWARTAQEQEAVFRLRYDIYIREMGFKFPCDHHQERMPNGDDRPSRLLAAVIGSETVGTLKLDWGRDAPLTSDEHRIYHLHHFIPIAGEEGIGIFSRYMVSANHRSGEIPARLFNEMFQFLVQNRIPLLFCDCRPHLINTYERLGFRTYASTYNDPVAGLLVPLVMVVEDHEYFRRIGSRLVPFLGTAIPRKELLSSILAAIPGDSPVHALEPSLVSQEIAEFHGADSGKGLVSHDVFDGLEEAEVVRLIEASLVIECQVGDRIVSEDLVDQTVFVVLHGTVEVRRGDQVLAVLGAGMLFGEVAFLLGTRRTADVIAVTSGVKVLALRQKAMAQLIESESRVAARFLLNLSRQLARRISQNNAGER